MTWAGIYAAVAQLLGMGGGGTVAADAVPQVWSQYRARRAG